MAIFSKAKEKQRARNEAARQGLLSYMAVESVEAEKSRTMAAEQARGNVFNMLGAPGTYDLPGTAGSTGTPGTYDDVYKTDEQHSAQAKGLLQYKLSGGVGKKGIGSSAAQDEIDDVRKGILDPKKFAAQASQSASFRIQSRQTAESEQLLAQQGPAWEKLSQSTLGQIHEGAATAMKETMRDLKNRSAKGGTARRAAMSEATEIRAKHDVAFQRVNETWNANLQLHDYIRQNAERVSMGNQRFLDGLPGIRDNYQQTMNSLANSMTAATQAASSMSQAGYQARAAVGDSKFVEQLIIGAVGVVAGYATGGATNAMFTSGGAFGNMAGNSAVPGAASSSGGSGFFNAGGIGGLMSGAGNLLNAGREFFTPGTATEGGAAVVAPGVTPSGSRLPSMPSGVVGGNL